MTEPLIITEDEMRTFLQFDYGDYPKPNDITFFIRFSNKRIALDYDGNDPNVKIIATFFLTKHYILRALATRSLSKGYIQATAEGRTVTKAYQELVLEAENVYQEYKEFLVSQGRREATSTNYMTTEISSLTRQEVIDIMTGKSNFKSMENARRFDYFWRR